MASENPFRTRVLAYLDILGWSELIMGERTADALDTIVMGTILQRVGVAREAARKQFADTDSRWPNSTRVGFFSDSVVYSCEPAAREVSWLVDSVQAFCRSLPHHGLYIRGAIVVGDLMHDDAQGTIAGRALIEGYLIERDVAKYPRVIVTDAARELLVGGQAWLDGPHLPSQVRVDRADGLSYLDIFRSRVLGKRSQTMHDAAVKAKAVADRLLRDTKAANTPRDLTIRAKRQWMAAYLDEVIAEPVDPSITD